MIVREYRSSDRAACLAVFDSNVGGSFLPSERPDFAAFLDALPGPYFVIEDDGVIIACGGYAANAESSDTADLCWGMVQRELQQVVPNGIADGLHRYDMKMTVSR